MDVRKMRNELLGKRLVAALESRNMEAYYVETKEEAVKKALELIPKGSSINMGGATSVKECGLYEALSNGEYQFYDRDKVSTQEEKQEIALKAFTSDYFLGSVNAMSECKPRSGICLRTKTCASYSRHEQGRKNRGRRYEPCEK